MKNLVLCFVVLGALFMGSGVTATAQEATPPASAAILGGLGYQELHITASNDGVEMPDRVDAGRSLIVYENAGEDSLHPFMLRLPADISVDQALGELGPEAMEPPAWLLDAAFPGFVGETLPDGTFYAVVDIVAGPHPVLQDSAALIEVVCTDATPAAQQTPVADGTASLYEMGFEVPETIAHGPQLWEVTNAGAVPHELLLLRSTVPVTGEQLVELFMIEDDATPPVDGGPSLGSVCKVATTPTSWRS